VGTVVGTSASATGFGIPKQRYNSKIHCGVWIQTLTGDYSAAIMRI
jgi:hypothetical protein